MDAKRIEKIKSGDDQPSFVKVGECLYRYSNGGTNYRWLRETTNKFWVITEGLFFWGELIEC
jgi:hypothetical protein